MSLSTHRARRPGALRRGASLLVLTLTATVPSIALATGPVTLDGPADRGGGILENRYYLMLQTQTFDGGRERSLAQKAGFARLRRGDESWIRIDLGDGAMTIGTPGVLAAGDFFNDSPTEVALAYDYKTHMLRGNRATSAFNNRFVAPLLDRSPPTGRDAAWTLNVTPAQLGVSGVTGEPMAIALKRRYFRHDGRDYVLLDYAVPAFSYRTAGGETVVHWAHGAALVDPGFGQIYWCATLQRAAAQASDGQARPYRYLRTFYAMDAAGKPLVRLDAIPELKDYLGEFHGAAAIRPIPAVTLEATDQTPLELAAKLDMVAFAVAENSANQLMETIGSVFGDNGRYMGQAVDTLLADTVLNNVIIPGTSAASGVVTTNVAQNAAIAANNIARITPAADRIADATRSLSKTLASWEGMDAQVKATRQTLVELQAEHAALNTTFLAQVRNASSVEDLVRIEQTASRMAEVEKSGASLLMALKPVIIARAEAAVAITKLNAALPALRETMSALIATAPALQNSAIVKAAQGLTGLIARVGGLNTALTRLGYVANVAGIAHNIDLLAHFDPTKGDVATNGTYEGWKLVGEPIANLLAIGGDFASGNMPATALDVANFAGGRAADIYMSMKGMQVSLDQADAAQRQEAIMKLRLAATQARNADTATIARMDAVIREINAGMAGRPTGFTGDKLGTDGRISIAYWLYLHDRDPQALRQYGIDPNGPIGVYPATATRTVPPPATPRPTQTASRTPQPVTQPRIPSGPGYPTAPTGTRRPSPNRPAADDPPLPTPVNLPSQPTTTTRSTRTDRPLQTRMDDPYITAHGTSPLTVTPLSFDPVTFDPVRFTPVTWDPVTWEPVTWDPPEWVPPKFDAPKPSEIPWTDFGDNPDLGADLSDLAWHYGDLSGMIATDLSRWAAWLKTQNVAELERMALAAGYPNLASALKDAEHLMAHARDTGFRGWANDIPVASGSIGIWASEAQHDLARAQIALGDLLDQSRGIFSSGGFSDIGISGFNLGYILRDYGVEDGDIIDIRLSQFGRDIFTGRLSLLNAGTSFTQNLRPGVAQLTITAVNEGSLPPNTAEINVANVTRGEGHQTYSLTTGQTATLRIEANAGRN